MLANTWVHIWVNQRTMKVAVSDIDIYGLCSVSIIYMPFNWSTKYSTMQNPNILVGSLLHVHSKTPISWPPKQFKNTRMLTQMWGLAGDTLISWLFKWKWYFWVTVVEVSNFNLKYNEQESLYYNWNHWIRSRKIFITKSLGIYSYARKLGMISVLIECHFHYLYPVITPCTHHW